MKNKKLTKIIATMGMASILGVGALVYANTVDYKNINLFSSAPISVMASEENEHDNPYEVFDGDTLVDGYKTLSEAFEKSFSGNIIKIWQDFDALETCVLSGEKNLIIEGNNCTINNKNWGKTIFKVEAGSTLEIKNLIIDGGATTWEIDYEGAYVDGNYARIPTKNYESETKATQSAIKSNGNLVAKNLTIQNIFAATGGNAYSGGVVGAGICVSSGTLQLVDCDFKHIAGGRGAAVDCNATLNVNPGSMSTEYPITSVVVTGTTFDGNHATGRGGGINLRNVKEANFINTTFKNNATTRNNGAGIMFDTTGMTWVDSNGTPDTHEDDIEKTGTADEYLGLPLPILTVDNCVFEENYCGNDGFAIEIEGATSIIKNSQFLRNVGVNQVKGSVGTVSYQVYHYGWVPQLLENCVFDGNKGATSCIGDHASNVSVVIKDSEFKNNSGASSVLIYNGQVEMDNVKFNNEVARNAVIDARSYVNEGSYSTEIDEVGPTLTLKNTTIKDTQGSGIDLKIRSNGSADGKVPFKVVLEGNTEANIQVSNNGQLEINSTKHTGDVTVDPTGEKDNVVVGNNVNLIGDIKVSNKYAISLIYYTADGLYTSAQINLPAGKVNIIDIQNFINEEKPGYVMKWYLQAAYTDEWDYNVTNAIELFGNWVEHEHVKTFFVAKGNAIYEGCDCGRVEGEAREISITPQTNLIEDGKEKAVIVTNTLNIAETDYVIEYYKKTKSGYVLIESAPKEVGSYKAVLKYNSLEAEVLYNIVSKEPFPVGVAIGCGVLLLGFVATIVWYFIKRKKQ